MFRFLSKLIFKINGWKVEDTVTYPKKCIIIAAPHTSNWDFLMEDVMVIFKKSIQNT